MYQKILNEAIEELREEEFKDLFEERTTDQLTSFVRDCVLETDFELRIPEDYINNVAERLSIYQELDGLSTSEELEQHKQQLIDRFGPMPRLVKELFHSFEMRWLGAGNRLRTSGDQIGKYDWLFRRQFTIEILRFATVYSSTQICAAATQRLQTQREK